MGEDLFQLQWCILETHLPQTDSPSLDMLNDRSKFALEVINTVGK